MCEGRDGGCDGLSSVFDPIVTSTASTRLAQPESEFEEGTNLSAIVVVVPKYQSTDLREREKGCSGAFHG